VVPENHVEEAVRVIETLIADASKEVA